MPAETMESVLESFHYKHVIIMTLKVLGLDFRVFPYFFLTPPDPGSLHSDRGLEKEEMSKRLVSTQPVKLKMNATQSPELSA